MSTRTPVPWHLLVAEEDTRARYEAQVWRGTESECHWWLGAISSSGHGKMRAGRGARSRIVSAHVLGYRLEYGADALAEGAVVRHRCDSPSCQNRAHWREGTRQENVLDYAARSRLAGHALADVRGAAGRAVAVRDAILAADRSDPDAVRAAIAQALTEGQPDGAEQAALW